MKIDIISGFLGAGKTTLIKKLLKEALSNEKIAIIENEYGEVGIDGNLLKGEKIDVKEITSGCICCSITGDFKEAIIEIIEQYKPDRIIIEPSGVAKLSQVIEPINDLIKLGNMKLNTQIVVIDVNNLSTYIDNFGEFYINQIINAKTIIFSRTQDANDEEIMYGAKAIRKLNPRCSIITTPWNYISAKRILEVAEFKVEELIKEVKSVKKPLNNMYFMKNYNMKNDTSFESWGEETPKIFSKREIEKILKKFSENDDYGTILRAKGVVKIDKNNWILFDYVPNEIKIKPIECDYTGRICIIGVNLKKEKIRRLFLYA